MRQEHLANANALKNSKEHSSDTLTTGTPVYKGVGTLKGQELLRSRNVYGTETLKGQVR